MYVVVDGSWDNVELQRAAARLYILSIGGQTGTSKSGGIYSPYFGTKLAFPVIEFGLGCHQSLHHILKGHGYNVSNGGV